MIRLVIKVKGKEHDLYGAWSFEPMARKSGVCVYMKDASSVFGRNVLFFEGGKVISAYVSDLGAEYTPSNTVKLITG